MALSPDAPAPSWASLDLRPTCACGKKNRRRERTFIAELCSTCERAELKRRAAEAAEARKVVRIQSCRPMTLAARPLSEDELQAGKLLVLDHPDHRPRTRGECAGVERPCPFVSCRNHLYLDVNDAGGVKLNFPDLEPWELPPEASCSLDIADQGEHTLDETGGLCNVSRERIRQIESKALMLIRQGECADDLSDFQDWQGLHPEGGSL